MKRHVNDAHTLRLDWVKVWEDSIHSVIGSTKETAQKAVSFVKIANS
jgi:hypothetical protein